MNTYRIFPGMGGDAAPSPDTASIPAAETRRANAPADKRNAFVTWPSSSLGVTRKFTGDPHIVLIDRPGSPLAERYRRLRLHLEQGTPESELPLRVTVITSAVPGEGKTTTATNLALAYAEDHERRTLLVDADLRRPTVSRFISPEPAFGLSEVLAGAASLDHALIEMTGSRLWVLPAGAPRHTPLELQQSENLEGLIAELRRRFDRIVIDAPPTVPFTDAAVLASYADGVLLVVRSRTTTRPLIRRASESLSGAKLLGVVLNDVEFTVVDRYYYGYDDYEPERYAHARE
jgi:capsular exopolysaccharide synthesis family protein